jgi:hypothetical protein
MLCLLVTVPWLSDVRTDPHWGGKIVWPKPTKILTEADKMLKRFVYLLIVPSLPSRPLSIFKNWWARKMVLGLTEQQREGWRVQLLAHGMLSGKKNVCFSMLESISHGCPGLHIEEGFSGALRARHTSFRDIQGPICLCFPRICSVL